MDRETIVDIKRVNISVGTRVLFGDVKDVRLRNLNNPRVEHSEGGTIKFTTKSYTDTLPGMYEHAIITIEGEGSFHLIYHDSLDEQKLAEYLSSLDSKHFEYNEDYSMNLWNRYDWCHYRNWGDRSNGAKFPIHFLSVDALGTKCDEVTLDDSVILGDWNYGFKLTDPKTNLAFAFGYGDVFIHRKLKQDCVCKNFECKNFDDDEDDDDEDEDPLEIDMSIFSRDDN